MQDNFSLPLFSLQPETREIPLTQGKVAIVDAADYEWLMQWEWCASCQHNLWYAVRTEAKNQIRMHRVILNAPPTLVVDHIDGNGLNNRRKNIRLCTPQQNTHNMSAQAGRSSPYRGVNWIKQSRNWDVRIKCNGRTKYLGHYYDEVEAAKVYDAAARELYGEFARLNFPNDEHPVQSGYKVGERASNAKLMPDQVREIRSLRLQGVKAVHLAETFGVACRTIWAILQRKTWRDLK